MIERLSIHWAPLLGSSLFSMSLCLSSLWWALHFGEAPPAAQKAAESPAPAGSIKVLALEQEANGIPGQKADQVSAQKMLIDPSGRRLILILYKPEAAVPPAPDGSAPPSAPTREVDHRIILNMSVDPPELIEVWDQEKTYRRTAKDLNSIQEQRDKQEAMQLSHLREMSPAEQKAFLEENHLLRDGRRVVDVSRNVATKKILGHDCELVKVTENGLNVISAWIAKDFHGATSFFNLYRRLGAFSREVLERVAGIEGLPLEAEIKVVTTAPTYTIGARCVAVKEDEAIPASSFEVPAGYKEKKEAPAITSCPICGKPVERAETKYRISAENGVIYYYCSKKCQDEGFANLDKALKNSPRPEIEKK
jgi:YHS domain-containing protein